MDPNEFNLASLPPAVAVCPPHVLLHLCCCGAAVLHSVLLSSDNMLSWRED